MPSPPSPRRLIPRVLSIAGSDSGGGAGIQADLKAFAACGVHGMTAITAITAQNTVGVVGVQAIEPEMILAQVRAVAEDIGVDAVKIGMLGSAATVEVVARALDELATADPAPPVVLDPVMISESGAQLLEPAARAALIERVLPRATVVTPNLPEARALAASGRGDDSESRGGGAQEPGDAQGPGDAQEPGDAQDPGDAHAPGDQDAPTLARAIHALGPPIVVVTGGHRDDATDVFFDGHHLVEIPGERHPDGAAHGSGCTHSSVLAARLAWGDEPLQAARIAKRRAAEAVREGLTTIGAGPGPVDILGVSRERGTRHGGSG